MNEHTFVTAVRQHEQMLYRVAYTVLHNDADCADALQDALLRAWRRLDTLKDDTAFRSWLTRIVLNCSKDILRRRRFRTVVLDESLQAPSVEDEGLREALASLHEGLRLPVTLYYLEGMSVAEVAHVMRLPQGTIKNRLLRARRKLAEFLNEEEDQ